MCVRGGGGGAAPRDSNTPVVNVPAPAPAPEHPAVQREGEPSRRRTSFVTEEGFEIALPPSPSQIHHLRPSRSKRRKSVFDEDGNEIVLCCKDDDGDDIAECAEGDTSAVSVTGSTSPTGGTSPTAATSSAGPGAGPLWGRLAGVATQRHVPHPPPKPPTIGVANGHATKSAQTQTQTQTQTQKFISRGGSSIISPFGDVLAGPQWEDDAGIIAVDVDFDDCIRGRLDLDTAGSYSRYGQTNTERDESQELG